MSAIVSIVGGALDDDKKLLANHFAVKTARSREMLFRKISLAGVVAIDTVSFGNCEPADNFAQLELEQKYLHPNSCALT